MHLPLQRAPLVFFALAMTLAMTLALTLTACSKGEDSATGEEEGPSRDATAPSPEDIGNAVKAVYMDAIRQVTALMASNPSAEELMPQVLELKEREILRLVELGRQRDALDTRSKAACDRVIQQGFVELPMADFQTFTDGQRAYADDLALFNAIGSFNVITQYAVFELLKEQAPEEAARLGIP